MDISAWLRELGLERYEEAFRENDVDLEVLPKLTAEDLLAIGVISVGHRRKLLEASAALTAEPSAADSSAVDSTSLSIDLNAGRSAAERRQLTVMFVDLVGSTALAARLDPEDMREVLRAYQDASAGVIARFEGFVAKFMGDGVLAYFGYPRAHEDEAERAVRTGLALAATVGELKTSNGEALAARIGIATGLVVVGDLVGEGAAQEQAVVGETPNFAARLQGIAAPGQVVISGATRRLLGAGFELQDLGERELKGIGAPVQAYVVTGERPLESRFEAMSGSALLPMVGRDQELALLLERWALAKAGEGQGVLLVGEAGIGKSRISRALLDAVADEPHTRIRYQCSPYHTDSALWPVIQQLNYAAGLAAVDPLEARLDKLEALLDRAGGRDAAPLIADLLGLDGGARYGPLDLTPQAQRARTLEALVEQMLRLAARQPVLVVVEDAHWIDPTTLEMIEQGLDRSAAARVLILLTSRPDRQPALAAHPHVTRLTLNRLGRAGVEAIVARLGGDRLPSQTIDAIIARTDGVPLFVEELTKAVLETGETAIPASLHELADGAPRSHPRGQGGGADRGQHWPRVRLPAPRRRRGPDRARPPRRARQARGRRADLPPRHPARCPLHLQAQPRPGRRLPVPAQGPAPAVARADRRNSGAAVRGQSGDRAGAVRPSLYGSGAHAGGRALLGARRRKSDRALSLCRGDQSLPQGPGTAERPGGWTEAQSAGIVAPDGPRRCFQLDARVRSDRGRSGVRSRPRALAPDGRDPRAVPHRVGSLAFLHHPGDLAKAQELSREIAHLGERLEDPSLAPHVHRTLGETALWRGEFAVAQRELSKCLAGAGLAAPKQIPGVQDPLVMCGSWLAYALWHLGYPDQALARVDAVLERAKESALSGDLGAALLVAAWVRLLRREARTAREFAETALRFNDERGHAFHVAMSDILLGSALVALEHDESGLIKIRDGTAASGATGAGIFQPWYLALLAAAHAQMGDPKAGLAALAEAETRMGQSGERWPEGEIHRLKGELTLSMEGASAAAEQFFRRSIEVAREQEARSPELRATVSLARLWAERGERQKAHDLLAPVYGWFTEGFDTADLKGAKVLLDELA